MSRKTELARMQEELLLQAAELRDRIANLAQLPEIDDFPDETALFFQVRFTGSGRTYRYVALKADDRWYVTGVVNGRGLTWNELVHWLTTDKEIQKPIYIAQEWVELD